MEKRRYLRARGTDKPSQSQAWNSTSPKACFVSWKHVTKKKVALANFKSALLRLQILLAEAQQMHRYEYMRQEFFVDFNSASKSLNANVPRRPPTNLEPGQCFSNCSHMSIGHVPPSIASSANKRSTQFLSGAVVRRKVGAKPQSIPSVFLLKSLKWSRSFWRTGSDGPRCETLGCLISSCLFHLCPSWQVKFPCWR